MLSELTPPTSVVNYKVIIQPVVLIKHKLVPNNRKMLTRKDKLEYLQICPEGVSVLRTNL